MIVTGGGAGWSRDRPGLGPVGGALSPGPGGDRRVEMRIRCKGDAMTLIRLQTVRYSLLRP